jgi:hypothetical protein
MRGKCEGKPFTYGDMAGTKYQKPGRMRKEGQAQGMRK